MGSDGRRLITAKCRELQICSESPSHSAGVSGRWRAHRGMKSHPRSAVLFVAKLCAHFTQVELCCTLNTSAQTVNGSVLCFNIKPSKFLDKIIHAVQRRRDSPNLKESSGQFTAESTFDADAERTCCGRTGTSSRNKVSAGDRTHEITTNHTVEDMLQENRR